MRRSGFRFATWFVGVALGAPVSAQVTQRASVDSVGVQGNSSSINCSISADGRFVAFISGATNLVPVDTNSAWDVFVRDLQTGTTERVSVDSGGVQGNADSGNIGGVRFVSVSADGRYVAFKSSATNLVPGDTNGAWDIFVRDRQAGTTERVSVDSGGLQGDGDSSDVAISADGRYVSFASLATNLVAADTNGVQDVFVHDLQTGTTERVSVDSGGVEGDNSSYYPSLSADGRYIAFASAASNLVPGAQAAFVSIFVRDRQINTTELVSVDLGAPGFFSYNLYPSISSDGRYVAFASDSDNLVLGDPGLDWDVFVRDRQSSTTELVSLDSGGAQGNGASGHLGSGSGVSISGDGRYVAFESESTNLVAGDTNGSVDIFVRDRLNSVTERASVGSGGLQGDRPSSFPSMSAEGRFVAFYGDSANLVPGDTNNTFDVFVRERNGGTRLESSSLDGSPSNGDSFDPSLSPDGRYLAFESRAANLVAADSNGSRDIFLRDRQANTTTLVTVDSSGVQANADSSHPAVSADGRYVAFESLATNLVSGDTNALSDVFVRDVVAGTTTRVSVDSGGAQGNGGSSNPSISGDGRYVAFDSDATNLVSGDTNLARDVFLRDRQAGSSARVSVDSGGTQGLGGSTNPSISADGRFVAFESNATNLVSGDTNGSMDVFVRDLQSSTTTRWSVDSGGGQGNGNSSHPAISGDGASVAFDSDATNLVAGDTNLRVDVFVRHGANGHVSRVSVDDGGTQGLGGDSTRPSTSVDGRSVGFASDATNLVSGDTNGSSDVFVHDELTGETRRVSVDSDGGQGAGASGGSAISADGRYIAFDSFASNLVDGDTNGFQDVFLRDEGTASAFETFCAGDGSVAPCPCSNSGGAGRGCENSGGTGGALLTATGAARLTADTVQFTSSGEKPTALSIFLQGTVAIAPANYGDGLRCTGGALKRLFVKSAVAGVAVAPQEGDLSVSARSAFQNAPIPLGATREYQVYYRDSVLNFCPSPQGSTFNVSNGIIVAWGS